MNKLQKKKKKNEKPVLKRVSRSLPIYQNKTNIQSKKFKKPLLKRVGALSLKTVGALSKSKTDHSYSSDDGYIQKSRRIKRKKRKKKSKSKTMKKQPALLRKRTLKRIESAADYKIT
eukprot:436598_1